MLLAQRNGLWSPYALDLDWCRYIGLYRGIILLHQIGANPKNLRL